MSNKVWQVVGLIFLAVGVAGSVFFVMLKMDSNNKNVSNSNAQNAVTLQTTDSSTNTPVQTGTEPANESVAMSTTSMTTSSTDSEIDKTACSNFDCLSKVAEKCEPITVIIPYSKIPLPILEGLMDIRLSGRAKYVIEKDKDISKCKISMTSLDSIYSQGDKVTSSPEMEKTINEMNETMKITEIHPMVCVSSPTDIISYLGETKKFYIDGKMSMDVDTRFSLEQTTTTFKLPNGNKLVCLQKTAGLKTGIMPTK